MKSIFSLLRRARMDALRGVIATLIVVVIGGSFGAASWAQVPGSLDVSFVGGAGKTANLAINTGNNSSYAYAVATQQDGKIVLAGSCFNSSNSDFCVARLNVDGSRDTSFAGPSGAGNGAFLLPIGTSNDTAVAIAIQPDGKITLAGTCQNGSDIDFCVARLNTDGSLDTSFVGPLGTGNGAFSLPIDPNFDTATALAIQPDGKLVIAGYCYNGTGSYFCVARLNPDGALDTSFGGPTGSVLLSIGLVLPTGPEAYALAIAIQPDGKLVLAGYCRGSGRYDLCVARLNADGAPDASFNGASSSGNGTALLSIGPRNAIATAVAIQPDGKILVAGQCSDGSSSDFCVARLHANGSLDASFDGPSGDEGGAFTLDMGTNGGNAYALVIQPDGKIVIAGSCPLDFCVVRLHADGSLDTSFDGPSGNGNGVFLLPIGAGADFARAMTIQSDGKLVIAGYCANGTFDSFCIARLNGGPFGAKQCSLDIDGDNAVLASTDMLISTRVALGITGAAVIDGISFAPHATRNTWPLIRRYLVAQCGMRIL
ncbi:MAG: delta-60 repeat domain-containing protein [Casimicrobium sp.]